MKDEKGIKIWGTKTLKAEDSTFIRKIIRESIDSMFDKNKFIIFQQENQVVTKCGLDELLLFLQLHKIIKK